MRPLNLNTFSSGCTGDLNEVLSDEVSCLSSSLEQTFIGNMKTKRQSLYKSNGVHTTKKKHPSRQQIGLALAMRRSDRNNQILDMLSAPGYGLKSHRKLQCSVRQEYLMLQSIR